MAVKCGDSSGADAREKFVPQEPGLWAAVNARGANLESGDANEHAVAAAVLSAFNMKLDASTGISLGDCQHCGRPKFASAE